MNLIRIGGRYINLDHVVDIVDTEESVAVYFSVPRGYFDGGEGHIEQESATFHGEQASALRSWLENIATDVMDIYHAELAEELEFPTS